MKLISNIRFYVIVFLLLPLLSSAQIDDVGLWLGASAEKKVTREAAVVLGGQIRYSNDITRINQLLADIGFEYSFTKKIKAGFHYRFIESNRDNYYSKRHRLYLDLSYKEKFNFLSLALRFRLQEQYSDIYSSETGKIPEWVLRSKLAAKFNLKKKYTPYVSVEYYYLLDNAKEKDQYFYRVRYEAGISYDFNRVHSINPFILFQHTRLADFNQLIYGISYGYSF